MFGAFTVAARRWPLNRNATSGGGIRLNSPIGLPGRQRKVSESCPFRSFK